MSNPKETPLYPYAEGCIISFYHPRMQRRCTGYVTCDILLRGLWNIVKKRRSMAGFDETDEDADAKIKSKIGPYALHVITKVEPGKPMDPEEREKLEGLDLNSLEETILIDEAEKNEQEEQKERKKLLNFHWFGDGHYKNSEPIKWVHCKHQNCPEDGRWTGGAQLAILAQAIELGVPVDDAFWTADADWEYIARCAYDSSSA